jgi:hypothetical protein
MTVERQPAVDSRANSRTRQNSIASTWPPAPGAEDKLAVDLHLVSYHSLSWRIERAKCLQSTFIDCSSRER